MLKGRHCGLNTFFLNVQILSHFASLIYKLSHGKKYSIWPNFHKKISQGFKVFPFTLETVISRAIFSEM